MLFLYLGDLWVMAFGSVKKAYYYMKKNGLEETIYASIERLTEGGKYVYEDLSEEALLKERNHKWRSNRKFSIVVPTYETNEIFLKELVNSVIDQTYSNWELIIADASITERVRNYFLDIGDKRIRYIGLTKNMGISANTNVGIMKASGDYIGLLDHDDLLTPDALYEMALLLEKGDKEEIEYAFIYSDEDKCDEMAEKFFEPNIKPDFNLDLLLTNNYICHFLVMKADLIKALRLRNDFDGAQDHDLVLRAYASTYGKSHIRRVAYGHIPKVLYHWRCHDASTAANPESKRYAYNSGRAAVKDFLENNAIRANVKKLKHNGFFRVQYKDYLNYPEGSKPYLLMKNLTESARGSIAYRVLLNRYDIGAIGGPLIAKGKIVGGIIDSSGTCPYDGLSIRFSGYMHRAILQQDAVALDIRNMMISENLARCLFLVAEDEDYLHLFNRKLINDIKESLNNKTLNSPYIDVTKTLANVSYEDIDYLNASIALCREIMLEGYLNYYDPEFVLAK